MKRILPFVVGAVVFVAAFSVIAADSGAGSETGDVKSVLASELPKVAKYNWGQSRRSLMRVSELVQTNANDKVAVKTIESALVQVLSDPESSEDAKSFCCRQLGLIGGDDSLKALEAIVVGSKPHAAEMGVFALSQIGSDAALATLLDALPQASGTAKQGLVNALGVAGNANAVDALSELAKGDDRSLVPVAISSLGRIGGDAAVTALQKIYSVEFKPHVADALLVALDKSKVADGLVQSVCETIYAKDTNLVRRLAAVRLSALRFTGPKRLMLVKDALHSKNVALQSGAIELLADLPEGDATSLLNELMGRGGDVDKVRLLTVIGHVGSSDNLAVVREAVNSGDQQVKQAAFAALASIGDVRILSCC